MRTTKRKPKASMHQRAMLKSKQEVVVQKTPQGNLPIFYKM